MSILFSNFENILIHDSLVHRTPNSIKHIILLSCRISSNGNHLESIFNFRLAGAQQELDGVMSNLKEKQKKLADVETKIAKLQRSYDDRSTKTFPI